MNGKKDYISHHLPSTHQYEIDSQSGRIAKKYAVTNQDVKKPIKKIYSTRGMS